MIKVLFVCLGNICRSPMAEGLFRDYVEKQGLSHQFHFESRATAQWEEGRRPHHKALSTLKKYDIDLPDKRAKKIKEKDFIEFDYIIGMDRQNVKFLKEFEDGYYAHKIYQFLPKKEVPDPWHTGNFEETYQLLSDQISIWIEKWMKDTNS